MVSLVALTNAFVAKLQDIPEVVALLGGDPAAIIPYIDSNPNSNNLEARIYEIKPGTVMVVHIDTVLAATQSNMEKWLHTFHFILKAPRDQSNLDLANLIVDGKPANGDGQIWRRCEVMAGVDPTEITSISRVTDTEGIDYELIVTQTSETGDYV